MNEWIEANSISQRYCIEGEGDEWLVLVHELGGCLDSWDDVVPLLAPDYRILRYDQRGCGMSEKCSQATMDALVEDLSALINAVVGPTRVNMAGVAFGAALSLGFAQRHRERVGKVVLASPALEADQAVRDRINRRIAAIKLGGMRRVIDSSLETSYPEAVRTDRERFERYRLRFRASDPEGYMKLCEVLRDAVATFQGIESAMLVIGCTMDAMLPPRVVKALAAQITGSKYMEIEFGSFRSRSASRFVRQRGAGVSKIWPLMTAVSAGIAPGSDWGRPMWATGIADKPLTISASRRRSNALLDAEADRLCGAGRYERSEARQDTRAGSYEQTLQTKASDVNLKVSEAGAAVA